MFFWTLSGCVLVLKFCLSGPGSSSEFWTCDPPVGTRPAEDQAGRHAAGCSGPDLTGSGPGSVCLMQNQTGKGRFYRVTERRSSGFGLDLDPNWTLIIWTGALQGPSLKTGLQWNQRSELDLTGRTGTSFNEGETKKVRKVLLVWTKFWIRFLWCGLEDCRDFFLKTRTRTLICF